MYALGCFENNYKVINSILKIDTIEMVYLNVIYSSKKNGLNKRTV